MRCEQKTIEIAGKRVVTDAWMKTYCIFPEMWFKQTENSGSEAARLKMPAAQHLTSLTMPVKVFLRSLRR
jgi:hypothetical protein